MSIQLIARGVQDEYFTGSPQTSFFKNVFVKHTEFFLVTKEFPFHNSFFEFGSTQICSLNGTGDIIRNITLKMKIPPIFVPNYGYTYPEVPTPHSFAYLDSNFTILDSFTTKMNTLFFTTQDLSWLPPPVSYQNGIFSFAPTKLGIVYIAFTSTEQALFWGFKNFIRFSNGYYIFTYTGSSEISLVNAGWVNRYFPGIQTYTPNVAPKLIKFAELRIGGQTIERVSGEFIIVYNDLFVPENQQLSIQKLTGYVPVPASTYIEYYVKIPFSLQVPKCALFRQDVEVFVEFQTFDTVSTIQTPVNTTLTEPISASAYGGYFVAGSNLYQYSNLITNILFPLITLPTSSSFAGFVTKFNSSAVYQYSLIIDGTGEALVNAVTCDSSGNMYIAGFYQQGTATITDEAGNPIGTLPTAVGRIGFVSKFNSSGVYQYSRIIDGSGNIDEIRSVTCDSSGNMYIAGTYEGTPTIKDQNTTPLGTLPTAEFVACYVSKFDSSGVYQYSRIIDSAGNDQVNSVTCDSSGNMYIAGTYEGTPTIYEVTSGGVSTPVGTLPTAEFIAGFVSKFNSSGVYQYSRIIDGSGNDQVNSVTCDSSGNMYIAGYYQQGTPTIKDEDDIPLGTLPTPVERAGFVSKFNSSGVYQYSRIIDSAGNDQVNSVTCDSSGNMYIAGYYQQGTPTIKDEDDIPLGTLPTPVERAGFVSKFNSSGVYQYSRIIDGDRFITDEITSVTCDSSGNMYIAGFYSGTGTIKDEAEFPLGTLPFTEGRGGFVSKFNSSGVYQYSRIIFLEASDEITNVTCDSSGNVYFSGYYTGTPTIKDQDGVPLRRQVSVSNTSVVASSNIYFLGDPTLIKYAPSSNTLSTFTIPGPPKGYKNMYYDGQYIYSFSSTGSNVAWRFNTFSASHEVCTLSKPFIYSGSVNTDGLSNVMSVPITPDANIIRYDTTLSFTRAHSFSVYPLDTTRSGFDYTASVYADGSLIFGSKERFVRLQSGNVSPTMTRVSGLPATASGVFYDGVSNVWILPNDSTPGELFYYNTVTKQVTLAPQLFLFNGQFNTSVQISSNTVVFLPSSWSPLFIPENEIIQYSLDTNVFTIKSSVLRNGSNTACLANSNIYSFPYSSNVLYIYNTISETVSNINCPFRLFTTSVYDGSQYIYATQESNIVRVNTLTDAFSDISGHSIVNAGSFFTTSKSLKIGSTVYMSDENFLYYFDLGFISMPQSIFHNLGQVPLFSPFGSNFLFATDKVYLSTNPFSLLNSNVVPMYQQVTALNSNGANVIIATSNSLLIGDMSGGDFTFQSYWSKGTFSGSFNKLSATGTYFLGNNNTVYDIQGNQYFTFMGDAWSIIQENANIIALSSFSGTAYNIFDNSAVYTVASPYPIAKYIGNRLYSCSETSMTILNSTSSNIAPNPMGHIEEYNSDVFFFPYNGNTVVQYQSSSLTGFDSNARPEYMPLTNTLSTLGTLALSDSGILTQFVNGFPTVLVNQRGKDIQQTTTLPYASMIDWYTQRTGATQGVKSIYGALIGSGTLNVTSNSTAFVYVNGSLVLSNGVYFKVQVFINGSLERTFEGFDVVRNFFSQSVVQKQSYSVGFTQSTTSLLSTTVFGVQGTDVITVTGLLTVGAASDTATVTHGTTVALTPILPLGLTGYSYTNSNIVVFTESSSNISFSANVWFTTVNSTTAGSRYTLIDRMVFSTCPFISKPSGNYYATQDNSLIVRRDGSAIHCIQNTLQESFPLYSNIYSPSDDKLFFFGASDATYNLIGIFDFTTNRVTHVNVKSQCPTGQVYNLVYNSGVLYALSDGPNLVYLIGTQVFDISSLTHVPKILTSIISVPIGDGVAFLPYSGSNVVCVNTTKSFYYQSEFPRVGDANGFDIRDGDVFGSSIGEFYCTLVFNGISNTPDTSVIAPFPFPPMSTHTNLTGLRDIQNSWALTTSNVRNISTPGAPLPHSISNPVLSFPKDEWIAVMSSTSQAVQFIPLGVNQRFVNPFLEYTYPIPPISPDTYRRLGNTVYMFPLAFDMSTKQFTFFSNVAPGVLGIGPNLELARIDSYNGLTFASDIEQFVNLSDDGKKIITTGNVYQYDGQSLLASPYNNLQVVSSNILANASTWVSYSETPSKRQIQISNIRAIQGNESNTICVTDSNIVCFSNTLEYGFTVVSGIQGPVRDAVFNTSNIMILADGSFYVYTNTLTRYPLNPKFNTQIIQAQNDIFIASSTDTDLYRFSTNTSTVDRFITQPIGQLGTTFSLASNVYTRLSPGSLLVYNSDAVPLYSQTFPYSIQASTRLNSTIYYSCPPNIVAYDTTKPFWLMSSYSNIGPLTSSNITTFTTDGTRKVFGIGANVIYQYDTITSSITTSNAPMGPWIPNYAVYDSKSIFTFPSGNVYTFAGSLNFPNLDTIPQVPVDYLRDLVFDGRYVYTASNIVYAIDTTTFDQTYQVLIQDTLPQFSSNVSGGYYDGQFLNITAGPTNTQIDLYPVTPNPVLEASIIANSAFLSEREKNWMNSGPLDYVIMQVQQSVINDGYYMVDFLNPTKEFILTGPLNSIKVFLNGNLLVNPELQYMSNVNQLRYHSRRSTYQNTYCISLSLSPEKNIPSGHINLSRIKETVFASETDGPVNVFALTHNVFRTRDGLGGLVFNTRM